MDCVFTAKGHVNVRSLHPTTLEITKEEHLTPRGDCIIAVASAKGINNLSEEFKKRLKDDNAVLKITIECNGISDSITASGSKHLILNHETDMVIRKSDFICPRTLAIKADKAAKDVNKKLVEELKKEQPVRVTLKIA